jgi:hypothetical protein
MSVRKRHISMTTTIGSSRRNNCHSLST